MPATSRRAVGIARRAINRATDPTSRLLRQRPHRAADTGPTTGADRSPLIARARRSRRTAPATRRADRCRPRWPARRCVPPNPLSTWSTSSDRPRTEPNWPVDEFVEFGQSHRTNLRRRRKRFVAHPYRICHIGERSHRLAWPPRRSCGEDSTSVTAAASASGSAAEPVAHCLGAQADSRSPTGRRRRAPRPSAHRPAAFWTPCRGRRRRSPDRRATAVRPGARVRPTAHGGTSTSAPPSRDTTTRAPSGSASPGLSVSSAISVMPRGAGDRRRRRDDDHRAVARRNLQHRVGRLEVQGADHDGLGGPVRTRHLERGQRGDQSAQRPGIGCGQPDFDSHRGTLADTRRATTARSAPASPRRAAGRVRPTPGASPLPSGGRPFDGRYSGAGFSSIHGMPSSSAASPPHAVITSDTTRSGASSRSTGTLSTAIRAARWWIFAPASVSSSSSVGIEPDEFDRVHPRRPGGVQPFGAGQQRRRVAGGQEPKAQRKRGKGVSGIGSGDHGDAHAATLPQRCATRLGP